MRRRLAGCAAVLWTAVAVAQKNEPAADVHIDGNGQEQTVHCHHNAVYITGNSGRFSIDGSCSTVHVQGSRNWIEVQDADWIKTSGNLNTVLYLTPATRVSDAGKGNSVSAKWQQ